MHYILTSLYCIVRYLLCVRGCLSLFAIADFYIINCGFYEIRLRIVCPYFVTVVPTAIIAITYVVAMNLLTK